MYPTFRDNVVLSSSRVIGHSTLDDGATKLSQNVGYTSPSDGALNPRTIKMTTAKLRWPKKWQACFSMINTVSTVAGLGDPHFESGPELPVMTEIFSHIRYKRLGFRTLY
jgi:hypothetical protein